MGVFRQLGDPVCPDCLCQHHGAAYAERAPSGPPDTPIIVRDNIVDGGTILSQAITITERCCVVVNAATLVRDNFQATDLEIERPLATIRTTQEDVVVTGAMHLLHHAAWEVLDPGTYTYHLVNRAGAVADVWVAWLKVIASDCEA